MHISHHTLKHMLLIQSFITQKMFRKYNRVNNRKNFIHDEAANSLASGASSNTSKGGTSISCHLASKDVNQFDAFLY
jgi:hypothetical protein